MTVRAYEPAVRAIVEALQHAVDRADTVRIERAMIAIYQLPPSDSVLSHVLRSNEVWQQGQLYPLLGAARIVGSATTGPLIGSSSGINVGTFVSELNQIAQVEDAPSINEFHVAETLVKLGGDALTRTGVNGTQMVKRVAELLGRSEPTAEDRQKVWCFCDTTFFQESRAPFDQIDWPTTLGLSAPVVLAVVPVVVRELDAQKSDPRPHRSRQQTRARQVLGRLDPIIDRRVGDRPVVVRRGVEVLLVDREPAVMPEGLNRDVADDLIVAGALEFRWHHPGLRVAVLSDDRGPRIKAGRFDLERISLPEAERRQDPSPGPSPGGASFSMTAVHERRTQLAALTPTVAPALRQAATDEHLVELWLHGRLPHTQRAYCADSNRFLTFVARPPTKVTLSDVQAFADAGLRVSEIAALTWRDLQPRTDGIWETQFEGDMMGWPTCPACMRQVDPTQTTSTRTREHV